MILGIDVGSVMVSVALVDEGMTVVETYYEAHRGRARRVLSEFLSQIDESEIDAVACTTSTPSFVSTDNRYDDVVCTIRAARTFHPDARGVITVGGERFALARFHPDGTYRSVQGNTSCAAGTGSFLDQQARRLGLHGSAELSRHAAANRGARPVIASRCSVFAKTDLIHAQQEGYGLEEICDGLTYGLARNLVDTLAGGEPVGNPVVFSGGVSLNRRVVDYVGELLEREIIVDEISYAYGAVGACLEYASRAAESAPSELMPVRSTKGLIAEMEDERAYHFPPLQPPHDYPQFAGRDHFEYEPPDRPGNPVETDVYECLRETETVFLGVDIGSTSTKGVLMRPTGEVVAAVYTRTAGRPIPACQALFRTIREVENRHGTTFSVNGFGTTGSGRKFVGRVFGADLVLDEITAHARAATALDPEIDTIIEIGGQDAKFTQLKDGRVTFSQMNSVCAAGTGSFLEEQAAKLDVPLTDYAATAFGAPSPLASDRCTVFMERDINHYLTEGYRTSEILAAALHSVRENYLQKVATGGTIGSRICFQGATAKNPALVASFRQKLGKPIFVSRFCHVTGAMGVALLLMDEGRTETGFRGLETYRSQIPVRTERCGLCSNRCLIRIAEVDGDTVAFGFGCGRDYDTDRYVPQQGVGFDLERLRKRVFAESYRSVEDRVRELARAHSDGVRPRVGLPTALHLSADLPFWRTFFEALGIEVVDEPPSAEALKLGKKIQQAEFCAPMAHLHGQVAALFDKAEHLFVPMYIARAEEQGYCYYTQFSAPVLRSLSDTAADHSLVSPALGPHGPTDLIRRGTPGPDRRVVSVLTESLRSLDARITPTDVRRAYTVARDRVMSAMNGLIEEYRTQRVPPEEDITVVVTGRPYTVLDPVMNKGILSTIAAEGVHAFFHDMLPELSRDEEPELLKQTAWQHAREIIRTAYTCATTDGLYPVLVTSFKCSPDSFVIDFFTRIMDAHDKPFLILQVDEHDSSVGYETRIEAGMRAFRNHHAVSRGRSGATPATARADAGETSRRSGPGSKAEVTLADNIGERTLLLPNWDQITSPLLVANLRRHGVDARALTETPEAIRRSMRLNTGQCIPASIIAQETLEAIEREGLRPEQAALWMPYSGWPCNIAMYPHLLKRWLEDNGAAGISVFAGDFSYVDISPQATLGAYFAYLFGGLLRRVGCLTRPYEILPGATDRAISQSVELLEAAFRGEAGKQERLEQALALFDELPRTAGSKPKVAIFGDLYVRDNEIFNQDLIKTIESAGGEVVTTPYSDYTKIIAAAHFKRLRRQGKYANWALYRTLLSVIELVERHYYERFERWVGPRISSRDEHLEAKLDAFGLHLDHAGESLDNILKIYRLLEEYPDLALFVQASPAFCCPSLVTEAMKEKIRAVTGVPVVSLTYDGTGTPKNDAVVPYLRFAARARVH